MDWKTNENLYDDALSQIGRSRSRDALLAALTKTASGLGFDHAALQFVPSRLTRNEPVQLSTYSEGWLDESLRLPIAVVARDPVLAHLAKSVAPIVWGAPDYANVAMKNVYELFRGYGLGSGVSVAVRGPRGNYVYLGFSSSSQRVASGASLSSELGVLMLSASAAFVAMDEIVDGEQSGAKIVLTRRELELLSWSRLGKTASDCSQILGISQATVHFHLKNAVQKLDAVSKQHAVLKALELRLIH
ncbi:MAG: hypothetical protein EAZ43_06080 [Betaproteobacteria bacterium]|nr:MAG: hypothetical protein EAZ43_06080 [Betaproteobacteria bacterium]